MEIYITYSDPTPLTDSIREAVMKIAVQYLPQVLAKPDNIEARTQLSWASTLAMSENLMRLGGGEGGMPLHGIEHALSGYYDVTHGDGLAALLPAWMKSTLPTTKARVKQLGKNVFGKTDGLRATEEWLEQVGMRLRLSDLGCKLEHADEIAELTLICSPWANLDAETVASIFVTGTGELPFLPNTSLDDGEHTWRVSAEDVAGNEATVSATFTVDTKLYTYLPVVLRSSD